MIADPREIQRLRFREGQDLLSRDFRDGESFESQLRWWHNRAVHGAFGVRSGLGVTVSGTEARVERGLAYDCVGRELILPAARVLPAPPEPAGGGDRVLVIRFREDDGAPSPGELAGVCFGGPPPQGAELVWIAAQRLRAADGVPLARVGYLRGLPVRREGFSAPVARPLARPRLGRGHTLPGGTAWLASKLVRWPDSTVVFALEVQIETGAAGFTRVPCYFGWLQRTEPPEGGDPGFLTHLPLSFHVAAEARNAFSARVHIRLPIPDIRITDLLHIDDIYQSILQSMARQQLSVCWLGIEMRGDETILPEVNHGHS